MGVGKQEEISPAFLCAHAQKLRESRNAHNFALADTVKAPRDGTLANVVDKEFKRAY